MSGGLTVEVITLATLRETRGVEVEAVEIARAGHPPRVCVPTVEGG